MLCRSGPLARSRRHGTQRNPGAAVPEAALNQRAAWLSHAPKSRRVFPVPPHLWSPARVLPFEALVVATYAITIEEITRRGLGCGDGHDAGEKR